MIYRKVRLGRKNICSLVQVNFVYNGHFILNSFSLTTQQTHIYRLRDTIRTRASDVTWEVDRLEALNCPFVSPARLRSLSSWTECEVCCRNERYLHQMARGCYDCGQETLWTKYLSWYHQTVHTPHCRLTTLEECHHGEELRLRTVSRPEVARLAVLTNQVDWRSGWRPIVTSGAGAQL